MDAKNNYKATLSDEKLNAMYSFCKEYAKENWPILEDEDWSDLPVFNFYNEFVDKFNLCISFDRTDNWDSTDIICSVFCDNATLFNSIVITRCCYNYTDLSLYKDIVDYLLSLEWKGRYLLEKFNQ